MTVIMDSYPRMRKGYNRELLTAVYCFISFLMGLTMVTRVSVVSVVTSVSVVSGYMTHHSHQSKCSIRF